MGYSSEKPIPEPSNQDTRLWKRKQRRFGEGDPSNEAGSRNKKNALIKLYQFNHSKGQKL